MERRFNGSMHFVYVAGIQIVAPSDSSVIEISKKAEAHLRSKFSPGLYTEPNKCIDIFKFMFDFYEAQLVTLIPKIGTAWWVGGIVYQYEQSGKISNAFKRVELSNEDYIYWKSHGPILRQSLDYLLEKLCLLGEIDNLEGEIKDQVHDFELALICSKKCVHFSQISNYTKLVIPQATSIKINPEGSPKYFEHIVKGDVDRIIQEYISQNNKEVSIRHNYMDQSSNPFDFQFHSSLLNNPFTEAFGISYQHFQLIVSTLVVEIPEISDPGKAPMLIKENVCKDLAEVMEVSVTLISSMLNHLILDKSIPREVWNSKQFNRLSKRPFLEFISGNRVVLMYSKAKVEEYLGLMDHDLTFNKIPDTWKESKLSSVVGKISNNTGAWFEGSAIAQLEILGFKGGAIETSTFNRYKNVKFDCGQIDFLGYHAKSNCLALFEFKMIDTGFDAFGIAQVRQYFLEGEKPFVNKFIKKIDWIKRNLPFIKEYLQLEFKVTIPKEADEIKSSFITYYPTLLELFYTDIPCKSLIQFVDDFRKKEGWPYANPKHKK